MSERGVEDPPAAVVSRPRKPEIPIGPVDSRLCQIDRRSIKTQQHMNLVAREILELIDLVADLEGVAEMFGRRMRFVFDSHGDFLMPGMSVKVAVDQLSVFGPLVEGIGRAVNSDKTLS